MSLIMQLNSKHCNIDILIKNRTKSSLMKRIFKPTITMSLLAISAFAVCIKLGFWQLNKADLKRQQQALLSISKNTAAIQLPLNIITSDVKAFESLRFKLVNFKGTYNNKYQVFLDNQVEDTKVGYHVLTPMQIFGSNKYVLIDRGWIKGAGNREIPQIETPATNQNILGDIWLPSTKFYSLVEPDLGNKQWQHVWQNLDMQRYAKLVPFEVLPYIVRLDSQSTAGGFVRNWPVPGDRVAKHLGYAYQWFGFAFTIFIIYLVLNIKKVEQ